MSRWAIGAAWLLAVACAPAPPPAAPVIRLVEAGPGASAYVEVTGIDGGVRDASRRLDADAAEWERLLGVRVVGPDGRAQDVAVAGRYRVADDALRFTPLFPFEPGRQYEVRYHAASVSPGAGGGERRQIVTLGTAPTASPSTVVTHVFPSGERVPANQLRMYIHFSAPMGRQGGLGHVRLLDERGQEVVDPFLPLEAELWNTDRTRYTLFFDPGRQKRGIRPNREMGSSLRERGRYTLIVDREWADGQGQPLARAFTRTFSVGAPMRHALDTTTWRISAPSPGTRDPLSVTFPAPLDHALLLRALGVTRDGQTLSGDARVDEGETRWTWTPAEPWRSGRYELFALPILEDVAGNRIGRAFEVESGASSAVGEGATTTIPFTLRVRSLTSLSPLAGRGPG